MSPGSTETEAKASPSPLNKRERLKMLAALRRTWRQKVVDSVDQVDVLEKVAKESALKGRFLFMTAMSAAIAVLGLLLSSPAVVIGAMLLSPLMPPIIGAGLSLSVGDANQLKSNARALAIGTVLAIAISAIIVFASPIQTVTPEIASRTRPNLFDLLVALFSALAGAYAMIRGRDGFIVGVAIATALMPPLAVIGYGLATFNWTVFGGSLLLFITNLMTIALAAAVMARFYGFSTRLTKKQTRFQVLGILLSFTVLAVPLAISLKHIAWETNASRTARQVLTKAFPATARFNQIELDYSGGKALITASVLTPEFRPRAEAEASRKLGEALGRPVIVKIDQFRVGTNPGAAEEAQLAAARAKAQADDYEREIASLTDRLSLVAGVDRDSIILDRDHRRAIVAARRIPGAELSTYRELERRVASSFSDWTIELRPPALPLPDIAFDGAEPDPKAIALVAWAGLRVDAPIELEGDPDHVRAAAAALADRGLTGVIENKGGGSTVTTRWTSPDRIAGEN